MCDISRGGGVGSDLGLQRNVHMTFLIDKIDMRSFPNHTNFVVPFGYICEIAGNSQFQTSKIKNSV